MTWPRAGGIQPRTRRRVAACTSDANCAPERRAKLAENGQWRVRAAAFEAAQRMKDEIQTVRLYH